MERIIDAVLSTWGAWGIFTAGVLFLWWRSQRALNGCREESAQLATLVSELKAEVRALIRRAERSEAAERALAETVHELSARSAPAVLEELPRRYPKGHPKAGQFRPRD